MILVSIFLYPFDVNMAWSRLPARDADTFFHKIDRRTTQIQREGSAAITLQQEAAAFMHQRAGFIDRCAVGHHFIR